MPHIIVEYTTDTITPEQLGVMLPVIFEATLRTGIFNRNNIKVRALAVQDYLLDEAARGFIHIQCRIHQGRNLPQKQQLSQSLLQSLTDLQLKVEYITVEVVDMHSDSYAKHSRQQPA